MYCCIKAWPNKMATLMTMDGVVLCTFENADEARKVWREWRQQQMQQQFSFSTPQFPPESSLEIFPGHSFLSTWLKNIVAYLSR
jgi:hypothetical protein